MKNEKTKWTRDADIPAVPGCRLGTRRNCSGRMCGGCGWNRLEHERRLKLIERNGLTVDPATGMRRLVLPGRGA